MNNKHCITCNKKTYIDKIGTAYWFINYEKGGHDCLSCYRKRPEVMARRRKIERKSYNKRRLNILDTRKVYYANNWGRVKRQAAKYRNSHKQQTKEHNHIKYTENKKEFIKRAMDWQKVNKEKYKLYRKFYMRQYRHNKIMERLA